MPKNIIRSIVESTTRDYRYVSGHLPTRESERCRVQWTPQRYFYNTIMMLAFRCSMNSNLSKVFGNLPAEKKNAISLPLDAHPSSFCSWWNVADRGRSCDEKTCPPRFARGTQTSIWPFHLPLPPSSSILVFHPFSSSASPVAVSPPVLLLSLLLPLPPTVPAPLIVFLSLFLARGSYLTASVSASKCAPRMRNSHSDMWLG